ncbi:MAG TPA: AMP-binding protein [Trueperaceae bacterium]|nr:AMP-binding protein [Trueperaceae bacterium]
MILDIAAKRAVITPDRPALLWEGRWLSYRELNDRAERLAGALLGAGVGKGDRVALLAHNHIAHIDTLLATAKTGAVYTPLNVRLSEREQRELADYLRPALVMHDADNADKASATGSRAWDLSGHEARLGDADLPQLPDPDLTPDDVQMILLTGGTTGLPKGAMLPYRQAFYNAVNTVMSWGLRQEDCVIQATPCYHAALNAFTVPLLHLGARVALQRTFDPAEYLKLVEDATATILFLVPTMFQMLASQERFTSADLTGVRWAISGGAPCPEPVRETLRRRGVKVRQGYGLTEAGVNCFTTTQEVADRKPDTVGRPMLHGEAVVRRPDGAPTEPNETGELTIRGPHVFLGYFERPEATREALRDGWLWTGDLAVMDDDGDFAIVGRRKEMFISGGENVYPVEVEAAIYDHQAVAECAVAGVADERWGEVGVAGVVLREGHELTAEGLREFLSVRLARYKVPKHVVFLEALPKSAAGKILKQDLPRLAGYPAAKAGTNAQATGDGGDRASGRGGGAMS